MRSAGMMPPGKGSPVSGSVGAASEQAVRWLKSPLRSAWVGTSAERAMPRSSRFHSAEAKKWSLSLTIGPPIVNPKSFRFRACFGWLACSRK